MRTFASILQAVGLAAIAGATAWYTPVGGILVFGVELVVVGVALENR